MKTWIMRTVGALNVLFSAFGFYYFALRLSYSWHGRWPGSPTATDWFVFLTLSALTCGLVASVGYLGVRLLRGDESVIITTAVVFGAEIVYFLGDILLFWVLLRSRPEITVGFFGIAQIPLDPQLVTGYPLLGGVALLLARIRRSVQTSPP